jgi:hypothetical protein
MGLKLSEKKALTVEVAVRYRKAEKKEKGIILAEFTKDTGYNRKYAIHILNRLGKTKYARVDGKLVKMVATHEKKRRKGGGRKAVYGPEVIEALRKVWAFFWYLCGKRLAPLMRGQMKFIADWPAFGITAEIKAKLLTISPATIDRKLRGDKRALEVKGISGTKPGTLLKNQIPVRVYYPWEERKPGFFEIDTVHHCGSHDSGEFCLTLTCVDVFSGWVELRSLLNKAQRWVMKALEDVDASLIFALLGLDSDCGSEFINHTLFDWCKAKHIDFTRSRSYHKNDNCHVEQKNDACVRNYLGYYRYDTAAECGGIAEVYRALCPLLNYFLPTVKLVSKTRIGAKIKKVYDEPASPYQRLLASKDLSPAVKAKLTWKYHSYNPVQLQQEVTNAINALVEMNRRKGDLKGRSLAAALESD